MIPPILWPLTFGSLSRGVAPPQLLLQISGFNYVKKEVFIFYWTFRSPLDFQDRLLRRNKHSKLSNADNGAQLKAAPSAAPL